MLDKRVVAVLSFLVFGVLASLDYFFFGKVGFIYYFHTFMTLVFGCCLFCCSYVLFRRGSGNKYLHFFVMLAGVAQVMIHLTLFFVGRC